MAQTVVTLDAAWLSGHPTPPFTIPANSVYSLATNLNFSGVSVGGPVFKLAGPTSALKTNGYYITVNGKVMNNQTHSDYNRSEDTVESIEGAPANRQNETTESGGVVPETHPVV